MTNFTITQLEYALAVARCGHFSRAAEQCNISQPSLSMQVAKLERIIGAQLFDRASAQVVPTPFGERFITVARRVCGELDRLQTLVEAEGKSRSTRLRVGIIPTVAPAIVHLLADGFVEEFPHASLSVHEETTAEVLRELRGGRLDAGIVSTPLNEADLAEHRVYDEPFCVCLPEAHPLASQEELSVSDLDGQEILLLREGHCMRNQALEVCRRAGVVRPGDVADAAADAASDGKALSAADAAVGPPPGVSFESGSFETLLPLVRRRAGITLVPALLTIEGTPHGVTYRPFRSPPPSRRIGIVTLRDRRPTIPIGPIVEILQERVAPTLGSPQAGEGRILEPFPEGL